LKTIENMPVTQAGAALARLRQALERLERASAREAAQAVAPDVAALREEADDLARRHAALRKSAAQVAQRLDDTINHVTSIMREQG